VAIALTRAKRGVVEPTTAKSRWIRHLQNCGVSHRFKFLFDFSKRQNQIFQVLTASITPRFPIRSSKDRGGMTSFQQANRRLHARFSEVWPTAEAEKHRPGASNDYL
jgi:hypothetical protein